MECSKNFSSFVLLLWFRALNLAVCINSQVQHLNAFKGQDIQLNCHHGNQDTNEFKRFQDLTVWSIQPKDKKPWVIAFSVIQSPGQVSQNLADLSKVTSQSGNAEGAICTFPFKAADRLNKTEFHFTCADSGREDERCWCSTTKDFQVEEKWGFCSCAFPAPGIRLLAEHGTAPGDYCHFPFKYKGNVYKECTTDHRNGGKCWCGTTYDVDTDERWGYCPCAGSSFVGNWGGWGQWTKCKCGQLRFRSRTCHPHLELRNIPTGRQVLCDGYSVGVEMCSCTYEKLTGINADLLDLMKRTTAMKTFTNSKKGSFKNPSIVISGAQRSDSGLYSCHFLTASEAVPYDKLLPTRIETYHINVVDMGSLEIVLEDSSRQTSLQQGMHGVDWLIWHWTAWQDCDRCGIMFGERRKYGFCYTTATFQDGLQGNRLPCSSPLLPEDKFQRLALFPDYMVVQRCKSRCLLRIKDYELVDVEPGEDPKTVPPVDREVVRGVIGDSLTLTCNGSKPQLPVAWQFDEAAEIGQTWPISRHEAVENVIIDAQDNLHFEHLRERSAGYYSCYVNKSLSVSYRLFVVNRVWEALDEAVDYSLYLIVFVAMSVFLLAICGTIKGGLFSKSKF